MKRKPIDEGPKVHHTYPLVFWRWCRRCRLEFRREQGWRYYYKAHLWRAGYNIYFCADCAPTKEAAQGLARNYKKSMGKPPASGSGVQPPKGVAQQPTGSKEVDNG